MLTTNYNVVQISLKKMGEYSIGDIFIVPSSRRDDWRAMKFDGLQIIDITYGFGIFLHFDYEQWRQKTPQIEVPEINETQQRFIN